jgi:hypothetical protein
MDDHKPISMVSLPIYVDFVLWYLVSFLVSFPSPDAFLFYQGHIKPVMLGGRSRRRSLLDRNQQPTQTLHFRYNSPRTKSISSCFLIVCIQGSRLARASIDVPDSHDPIPVKFPLHSHPLPPHRLSPPHRRGLGYSDCRRPVNRYHGQKLSQILPDEGG